MNDLDRPAPSSLALPADVIERARETMKASLSENTQRNYKAAMRVWEDWCNRRRACVLPATPEAVIGFLQEQVDEGKAYSTIAVYLAALRLAHEDAGFSSPTLDMRVMRMREGVRNKLGVAPREQKAALRITHLARIVAAIPATASGTRDKAMLLLGWACGLRRSEIVELDRADVRRLEDGYRVFIKRAKQDQVGKGAILPLSTGRDAALCPVRALDAWLALRGDAEGVLFGPVSKGDRIKLVRMDGREVARRLIVALERAGFKTGEIDAFGGHSLRAGMITEAASHDIPEWRIRKKSRHKDANVMESYIREAHLFDDDPMKGLL